MIIYFSACVIKVMSQNALGYDVARTFVTAIDALIKEQKTLTGAKLTEAIRKVQYSNLLLHMISIRSSGPQCHVSLIYIHEVSCHASSFKLF